MEIRERKRKFGKGYIIFDKSLRRYFFENIDDESIQDVYRKGFDIPLRVQWRLTKKCNLNCRHCYLDEKNNKEDELNINDLKKIANKIVSAEIFEVLITGGEPTIKGGLRKLLDILCPHCFVTIFTNAYDEIQIKKIIPKIKKFKDSIRINVSLDGPKEVHDKVRGKGSYDKTVHNIKRLQDTGAEIVVNTVLTKTIKPHILEFVKEMNDICPDVIQFSKFYPLGKGKEYVRSMLSPREFKEVLKILTKLSIDNPVKIVFDHTFSFLIKGDISKIKTRKCSGGISKIVIESNGDVYPCQLLPLNELKMGNLLNQDLTEIWSNPIRNEFIKDFFPDECKKCDKNEYCKSGCKATSYSIHKVFKYKDPYCIYER